MSTNSAAVYKFDIAEVVIFSCAAGLFTWLSIDSHVNRTDNSHPKEMTLAILCDLSKAFDVISHDTLMQKFDFYGIRGIVKDWILNYLTDRTQYVQFEANNPMNHDD